jgi:adenine phosphoribosyltransferase
MADAQALARAAFLERFEWDQGHANMWRVFADPAALGLVVAGLADPWRSANVTKVCAVEARGFILGSGVAVDLHAGFVGIRKAGALLPGPKLRQRAAADYRGRSHELVLQQTVLTDKDRVLLVDDWAQVGSQALAARNLIERSGATYVGFALIVDQLTDAQRLLLGDVRSIVRAVELPPGG